MALPHGAKSWSAVCVIFTNHTHLLFNVNHELNTVDLATFKDIVSLFIFRVVLLLLLLLWESVIVICFAVRYFMSILVLHFS